MRPFCKVGLLLLSLALTAIFLFPIVWMVFVAINPVGKVITTTVDWFSPPYTPVNLVEIVTESPINRWMINSSIVAIATVVLGLIVTTLAAFAMSKIDFRFKGVIFFYFLLGILIPGEATIISLFAIAKWLGILNSYAGLVLPGLAGVVNIVILKGFFDNIPKELSESAEIDGAGLFTVYHKIVIPLSKPALATLAIFTFLGSWNNFLWPFLALFKETLFTIPIGIPRFNSNYNQDYVLPMAANTVAVIPVVLVFLGLEKYIVKGITLSGLKG